MQTIQTLLFLLPYSKRYIELQQDLVCTSIL